MTQTYLALLMILVSAAYADSPSFGDLGKGQTWDTLHVHHAPDPVNVRTGNFYLPLQDYYKPCFNLPIEIFRSYNSFSTATGPFGKGWTFSYDIQVMANPKIGLQVLEADGFLTSYSPKENQTQNENLVERVVSARKKDDQKRGLSKSDNDYDEYKKKLMSNGDFLTKQKMLYFPKEATFSPSGQYVSKERGHSTLEENKGGYVRVLETGRTETFNKNGNLIKIEDRNHNVLEFTYGKASQVQKISDGCGQSVTFKYNRQGYIQNLIDHLGRSVTYTYDKNGYLSNVLSLDRQKIEFKYDGKGLMTALVFPDNSQTKIIYDAKTNRVTKQIGPGTKITTYSYSKSGGTVSTLVEDTQGEKSKYEYIDAEHKTIHTDRNGNKTITIHMACCGKPLSIKDAKGKGDQFKYDSEGNLIERINALGQKTLFKYDPRFRLPTEVIEHTGESIRYVYDQNGNMTFSKTSKNEHTKITYEPHGKMSSIVDHLDNEIRFTYDNVGNPTRIEKLDKKQKKAILTFVYDKNGDIVDAKTDPTGEATIATIKNTISALFDQLKPIGIDFKL